MNMLSHVRELSEAGVDSIKIEGRAKGAYYVASAVNAYRHVLDGEPADAWQAELETTSHRPYSTGFYFGTPGQNQGVKEYARDYQMVARVVSCGKNAPSLAAGESADGALAFFSAVRCRRPGGRNGSRRLLPGLLRAIGSTPPVGLEPPVAALPRFSRGPRPESPRVARQSRRTPMRKRRGA